MKQITLKEWTTYRDLLSKLSAKASDELRDFVFVQHRGLADLARQDIIDYAFALITKYGEGAGALAAQFHDDLADLSHVTVPPAQVADLPSYQETAIAINGSLKQSPTGQKLEQVASRLVKQVAADTTLQNAERDGAQFAWVPSGDTCAFCIALASRGWQYMSSKTLRSGHAEHIHAHCDCQYAVRFNSRTTVAGYDPSKYKDMYYGAEGSSSTDKINYMRRQAYKASNLRREKSNQKMIEYPQQDRSREVYDYIKRRAESNDVKNLPVEMLSDKLTKEQIISKIAGGDMTEGSCSSAAYAYIGNLCGYDVTDFRGGDSQWVFAQFSNIDKIDNMPGLETQAFKLKKEASDLAKTLKELNLEEGKEYRLTAGKHAAIIRNTSEGLQYLELQSNNPERNGWQFFERTRKYTMFGQEIEEKRTMTDTLVKRFGCRKTVDKAKYSSRVYEKTALLTDVDSYKNSAQFKDILGYLNTNVGAQKKGTAGGLK